MASDTSVLIISNNITCPAESAGSKPASRKDLSCMQCHNLPWMYSAILPVNGVFDRELVECVQARDPLP